MAQSDKIHEHTLRRFFFDILRDNNSSRYGLTKFAAFVGLILLVATVIMSLILMWKTKIVDHVLFLELLGFILTLLGFKNNFGFHSTDTNSGEQPASPVINPEDGKMGNGQTEKDKITAVTNPKEQADFVDDSLKG